MLTVRIKTRRGRAQTPSPPPPAPQVDASTAPADAAWRAIVGQLLATPSAPEPYERPRHSEYAWARRLGMHINRPPKRR